MRAIKNAKVVTILPSELEQWKNEGYHPLDDGDASKSNSDYFMVMCRDNEDGTRNIRVVCPSFLRGPLGFTVKGCISY